MQSAEILRDEHKAVLAVLEQLEQATELAASGVPVPRDIFEDILEFFVVFVEHCHNSKEESAVFGQVDWDARGKQLVSQLIEEHEANQRLVGAYSDAVAAYVPGDRASAQALADAVAVYGAALRQHVAEEDEELLPSMARTFAADEDARITREFDRIELEEIGEGVHERLHGMIDSLPGRIARWAPNVPA